MQRGLIVIGLILLALGLAWPLIQRLGLGHLPGDIAVERENFRFYFPVTTLVIVSIVVSVVVWLFRK